METEINTSLPPDSNNKLIDESVLGSHLSITIKGTIQELSSIKPSLILKTVWRPDERGYKSFLMPAPNYLMDEIREEIRKIGPEIGRDLIEYLWDCGRPKFQITGPNPDKTAWGQFVFLHLIYRPILDLLEESSIEQLIDSNIVIPWNISDKQIKDYAPKQINEDSYKPPCLLL